MISDLVLKKPFGFLAVDCQLPKETYMGELSDQHSTANTQKGFKESWHPISQAV